MLQMTKTMKEAEKSVKMDERNFYIVITQLLNSVRKLPPKLKLFVSCTLYFHAIKISNMLIFCKFSEKC